MLFRSANRASQLKPVVLAPTPGNQIGEWKSPIKVDPFTVSIPEKVALLLAANEAALKVKGVRNVSSSMFFLREEKTLMTSDGSYIVQTIYRTSPSISITAVSSDFTDFQTRQSADIAPMGLGYEWVTESRMLERTPQMAEDAVAKLSAKPVEPGRYDLLLHPSNMWLTIHETVAHPTELDRALGFEANYAGTSFVAPPEAVLGKLKFGSDVMNIVGDREQPRADRGRPDHACVQHAGDAVIVHVDVASGHLGRHVGPRYGLADDGVVRRIAQRRLRVQLDAEAPLADELAAYRWYVLVPMVLAAMQLVTGIFLARRVPAAE